MLIFCPGSRHLSNPLLKLKMSDATATESSKNGSDGRPLGPDGRPLPGPQQMQQVIAQKRMAQQQAQVDDVVGIMRTNVEKVLERDQKLSELDERAYALQNGASQFEKQAGKLKNKFWLQNMKWIVIGSLLLLIFLIVLYLNYAGEDSELNSFQDSSEKATQVSSAPEEVLETKDTAIPTPEPETDEKEAIKEQKAPETEKD